MRAGGLGRKRKFAPVLLAGVLQGCIFGLGGPLAPIPDSEITAEEFDDTIAFEPAGDAEAAAPPLEVHEIDESQVTAAGGKKVVHGKDWLQADDFERNDILNLIEEAQPQDSILVIVVATGDIWQIPFGTGQMLPEGVRPWTGDEYFELDEYSDGPRYGIAQMTLPKFVELTSVANSDRLPPIRYVHNFGEFGYREIASRQGSQVALAETWLRETPAQRYLRLAMLRNFLQRQPQFQGEGNQVAFGVMVPHGSVYVMPERQYANLIGQRALIAWTAYEVAAMPVSLLLLDRAIRNSGLIFERAEIP